jgi:hypothetical protein
MAISAARAPTSTTQEEETRTAADCQEQARVNSCVNPVSILCQSCVNPVPNIFYPPITRQLPASSHHRDNIRYTQGGV